MKEKNEFGTTIRSRRRALGLTLKDVAERVGCSIPYVSELERGTKEPPPHGMVTRFADALGVDEHGLWDSAQLSRRRIELELEDAGPTQRRLALLLHRRFEDGLTDAEAARLLEQIEKPRMEGI